MKTWNGLHASHFVGRGNFATRWLFSNIWAQCYACHVRLGSAVHRGEFEAFVRSRLSEAEYEELIALSQDGRRGQAQWSVDDLEELRDCLIEYLRRNAEVLHTAGGAHGYTRLMRQVLQLTG